MTGLVVNIFSRLALLRTAWRYSKLLPGELEADWGESDTYTAGQIAATLDRRGEAGRYVALAYAAFMTEADYSSVAQSLPVTLPYSAARMLVQQARSWGGGFSSLSALEATSAATGNSRR